MAGNTRDLAAAVYQLADEIRDGKWRQVGAAKKTPAAAFQEMVDELERRCPGFTLEQYQRAIADGLFATR